MFQCCPLKFVYSLLGDTKKIIIMDLTTTAKVKAYLGKSDSADDAVLATLVTNVSGYIEKATGRNFDGNTAIEEILDGCGLGDLILRQYPVIEVTKIEYNNGTSAVPVWTLIDPSNYTVKQLQGMVYGAFPAYQQNIKVTYKAGYATVPADLEQLATELVAKKFEQRHAQGKANERLGEASITWATELTQEQKDILENYTQIAI